MDKVKIIDRICGCGKTTWMINHMKNNSDKKWLFVSPYLEQVGNGVSNGRLQRDCPELSFQSPVNNGWDSKSDSLKYLVENGYNVSATHQLYKGLSNSVMEIIRDEGYCIVIDEVMDLISKTNIHHDDVDLWVGLGLLHVDDTTRKVSWNATKAYKGDLAWIKKLCDLDILYYFQTTTGSRNLFMSKIPPRLITSGSEVYVLTYMFDGSLMKTWLDIHTINYMYYNPPELRTNRQVKKVVQDKLHIVDTPRSLKKLNRNNKTGVLLKTAFSKNAYARWWKQDPDIMDVIRKACDNTIRHKFPAKSDVYYTVFKDWADKVEGERMKKIIQNFHEETGEEVDIDLGSDIKTDNFVAKNQKATNMYSHCNAAIYLCNTYPNLTVNNYISGLGGEVDSDIYALSELIQWIFRGCIRNGEDMWVMIASDRMRQLLEDWMELDE